MRGERKNTNILEHANNVSVIEDDNNEGGEHFRVAGVPIVDQYHGPNANTAPRVSRTSRFLMRQELSIGLLLDDGLPGAIMRYRV
jgi:hypothetical protein